jgi:hypothetical protein
MRGANMSSSFANLADLVDGGSGGVPLAKPGSSSALSADSSGARSEDRPDRLIMVSNQLPVRMKRREGGAPPGGGHGWEFEWDEDSLVGQAKAGIEQPQFQAIQARARCGRRDGACEGARGGRARRGSAARGGGRGAARRRGRTLKATARRVRALACAAAPLRAPRVAPRRRRARKLRARAAPRRPRRRRQPHMSHSARAPNSRPPCGKQPQETLTLTPRCRALPRAAGALRRRPAAGGGPARAGRGVVRPVRALQLPAGCAAHRDTTHAACTVSGYIRAGAHAL